VIYLGKGKSAMATSIHSEGLHYEYNLLVFKDISYKIFLSSDQPEEQLLAVLANFEGENPETVITTILQKVRHTSKGDFSENRYLQQLRILIQLRNLSKQFNHVMQTVSKFFKEEKDPLFKKGKEEGKEIKSHEVVESLISELRLEDEQVARIAKVSVDFVRKVRASLNKK